MGKTKHGDLGLSKVSTYSWIAIWDDHLHIAHPVGDRAPATWTIIIGQSVEHKALLGREADAEAPLQNKAAKVSAKT
jgi:hypothetical protein